MKVNEAVKATETGGGKVSSLLDCYARPKTRGELAEKLRAGVKCEVVGSVAEMTTIMLSGWLGLTGFSTRDSENAGWVVFEA